MSMIERYVLEKVSVNISVYHFVTTSSQLCHFLMVERSKTSNRFCVSFVYIQTIPWNNVKKQQRLQAKTPGKAGAGLASIACGGSSSCKSK